MPSCDRHRIRIGPSSNIPRRLGTIVRAISTLAIASELYVLDSQVTAERLGNSSSTSIVVTEASGRAMR